MLDILIRGGFVIDGTGSEGFHAAVGVERGTLRILRGDTAPIGARRVIDAFGHVITPGFIDVHAHSALAILADPLHEAKVRQGVTTELIGVDGNSYAPFLDSDDLRQFRRLNAGLEGNPALDLTWSTVAEYLAHFDRKVSINIGYVVGNAPIRINAVGWAARTPTSNELDRMAALTREAIEDGAFGLSTGLDYPPGNYADTDEIVTLARETARLGGIYHTHVRYRLGDRFLDPFREAIEIGRRSGVHVHITHLLRAGPVLELLEQARAEGIDVTFDTRPQTYGSTRLLIVLPDWTHDGGPDTLLEILGSPRYRDQLRREVAPRAPSWDDMWLTNFTLSKHRELEGRSIADIAADAGKHVVDTICDLLVEEDLGICYVARVANDDVLPSLFAHPLAMSGSDAVLLGEFPAPRSYGCFPTYIGDYVRTRQSTRLSDAIRKLTSLPAMLLGLSDRGILRDGMQADLVIFDPDTIGSRATREHPKVAPEGIRAVIVSGEIVVDEGVHTGARPGRALRARKAPRS